MYFALFWQAISIVLAFSFLILLLPQKLAKKVYAKSLCGFKSKHCIIEITSVRLLQEKCIEPAFVYSFYCC